MNTVISAQEAQALHDKYEIDRETDLPTRYLTKLGETQFIEWVRDRAKIKITDSESAISAWILDALEEIQNVGFYESVVYEMRQFESKSGNPETYSFSDNEIEWRI